MNPTDDAMFMWATFWTPPPPDNADRNDLVARAQLATHTSARLSERQAEAVDATPKQIEKSYAPADRFAERRAASLSLMNARNKTAAAKRRNET